VGDRYFWAVVVMVEKIKVVVRDTTTSGIRAKNLYLTAKGRCIIVSIQAEISSIVEGLGPPSHWFDKIIADDVVTPLRLALLLTGGLAS
jgi:hypothetical protein